MPEAMSLHTLLTKDEGYCFHPVSRVLACCGCLSVCMEGMDVCLSVGRACTLISSQNCMVASPVLESESITA